MKSLKKTKSSKKPVQKNGNGRKKAQNSKFYAPGEKMSAADRALLRAWKATYENRESYLELMGR